MKKFHSEKNEPDERQAYNDMLGLENQDFDPKDLMDVYSGYSQVNKVSTGKASNSDQPKVGKVNCIGY